MKRLVILFLLAATLAPPAHAWGKLGHRLVASLAEHDLKAPARAEIARLLVGEADPNLAAISTWADQLRANDPDLGRRSAPWHYVNLGEHGCTYEAARDCADGDCVIEAIRTQAGILGDRGQPLDARRRALKFVVHFVGDIHQPLHTAYAGDKGGNTRQIRIPTRSGERGGNLHGWWDSGMIESHGLDEAAYLERLHAMPMAVALPRDALPPQAETWAREACAIAVSPGFYPDGARLPAGYAERWTPVADAQMRRAGARLAQILDAALAP